MFDTAKYCCRLQFRVHVYWECTKTFQGLYRLDFKKLLCSIRSPRPTQTPWAHPLHCPQEYFQMPVDACFFLKVLSEVCFYVRLLGHWNYRASDTVWEQLLINDWGSWRIIITNSLSFKNNKPEAYVLHYFQ